MSIDHPAELSFECHKIEEQFVLLESRAIHCNTPSCLRPTSYRPAVSHDPPIIDDNRKWLRDRRLGRR